MMRCETHAWFGNARLRAIASAFAAITLGPLGCGDDDAMHVDASMNRPDGALRMDAGPGADARDTDSGDVRDTGDVRDSGPGKDGGSAGLEISGVSLFQSVEIPLYADSVVVDVPERSGPIVSGRSARVTVFLDAPDDWSTASVTATVEVTRGGTSNRYTGERLLSADSLLADPSTAVQVDLPASELARGATYSVTVGASRVPSSGDLDLGVTDTGPIRILVIPYRVNGFTPDVSPAVIDGYRDAILAVYPTSSVEISVGDVRDFGSNDVGDVLIDVGRLQDDAETSNVYYYGMVSGVATRDEFEGGTGTSENGGEDPQRAFFAAGAAFGDARSESTFIHEIGHTHGLEHAPCGNPPDVDPSFPHADGSIGSVGFDFRTGEFIPADSPDLMTYCQPRWIGTYHYRLLAEHIQRAQGW